MKELNAQKGSAPEEEILKDQIKVGDVVMMKKAPEITEVSTKTQSTFKVPLIMVYISWFKQENNSSIEIPHRKD